MGNLNNFNIEELKHKYNLSTFIETGTYYGAGIDYAKQFNFKDYFSCECVEEIYKNVKQKYINDKNVFISNMYSFDFLNQVLQTELNDNCLFWLDAHYPGADAGLKSYDDETDISLRLPLKSELDLIRYYRVGKKDVILIDDLRIYETGNFENGNIDDNIGNKVGIDFIYDLFEGTHNIEKSYKHEGYISVIPK